MFEILDTDAMGRIGRLEVNGKEMITPNLFPVVHPYRNSLAISEIEKIGAQSLFTNAYILYQNKHWREMVLEKGIHEHLGFQGIIATDSGAFQQYMYNEKDFRINAEQIESFQENIKTDFGVILDWPVQLEDSYEVARQKVKTTIMRAKDNINRRVKDDCHWFGPIHGARFPRLLKLSANSMKRLDFDVNAIGGLVKAFLEYRFDVVLEILLTVKRQVYPNKPIHMFGLGLPQFFSLAVACGCDIMDSAAYILFAKENRYFTLSTGTKNLEELSEFPCNCPICSNYTPSELRECNALLRTEMLAKHNLFVSFLELKTIRQAIREGNLWELVDTRIRNHPSLVKAFRIIKKHENNFEIHEKIYKNHGRLLTSSESQLRPLFYRYVKRIQEYYRPPKQVKYLLIIPELDTNISNSPSINNWLQYLNNNDIIDINEIHVVFLTYNFGLVPLELGDTFPMGQYESIINITNPEEQTINLFLQKCEKFLLSVRTNYYKSALMIPRDYHNQFNEKQQFKENRLIRSFSSLMKRIFESKYSLYRTLEDILKYFKKPMNQTC